MLFKACQVQKREPRRTGSAAIAARSPQLIETDAQSTSWRSAFVSPWRRDHTRGSQQDTHTEDGYSAEEAVGGTSNRQTHDAPQEAE